MFFGDEEKEEKEDALKKLKEVMLSGMGDRFGKMKKPMAASMTIEKMPSDETKDELDSAFSSEDDDDSNSEDLSDVGSDDNEGDISDEDKSRISELYHKYCV